MVRKKTLDERWHSCLCGCELDWDTASAKVILDLGRKQLSVGRDAANVGDGVEASGQRPEARSPDTEHSLEEKEKKPDNRTTTE